MKTLISVTALRLLMPLFIGFSIYLLFRGHNAPGGGFIGGLIGSIPFVFHAMLFSKKETQRAFRINTFLLIATGLLLSAVSSIISLFMGDPLMTSIWGENYLPIIGKPGTPVLFDVGVYLTVLGVVMKITFTMEDE